MPWKISILYLLCLLFCKHYRSKQSVWSALFIIDVCDVLHAHSARWTFVFYQTRHLLTSWRNLWKQVLILNLLCSAVNNYFDRIIASFALLTRYLTALNSNERTGQSAASSANAKIVRMSERQASFLMEPRRQRFQRGEKPPGRTENVL